MYIRTIGAAAVATLVAAGAYAPNVNTDADPSAPFSAYKSYLWTAGTPSLEARGEQRIRSAVENAETRSAGPNMLSVYGN